MNPPKIEKQITLHSRFCREFVKETFLNSNLESRYRHTIAVSQLMKQKAITLNLNPQTAEIIGLLHDIGYAKEYAITGFHPLDGYNAIFESNPHVANQILRHTSTPEEAALRGIELPNVTEDVYARLLSYADCRVNAKGFIVTFEGRLKDIVDRYGESSLIGKANIKAWNRLRQEEKGISLGGE